MSDAPKAPLTTTTSIWPAAAVLITAVAMLAVFLLINVVTDGPTTTTTQTPIVVGTLGIQTGVNAGDILLQGCEQGGEPPLNISDAFLLPVGTRAAGDVQLPSQGAGEFDCFRSFTTPVPASKLLGFYASELEARGWNLFSRGATNGDPQTLFQKAGSDTFYWVAGITVTKQIAGTSYWTLLVYQNSNGI